MQDTINDYAARPIEVVRDYPVSSMMLVFSVGLGVGVIASQALFSPPREEYFGQQWTKNMSSKLYDSLCEMTNAIQRSLQSHA